MFMFKRSKDVMKLDVERPKFELRIKNKVRFNKAYTCILKKIPSAK